MSKAPIRPLSIMFLLFIVVVHSEKHGLCDFLKNSNSFSADLSCAEIIYSMFSSGRAKSNPHGEIIFLNVSAMKATGELIEDSFRVTIISALLNWQALYRTRCGHFRLSKRSIVATTISVAQLVLILRSWFICVLLTSAILEYMASAITLWFQVSLHFLVRATSNNCQ